MIWGKCEIILGVHCKIKYLYKEYRLNNIIDGRGNKLNNFLSEKGGSKLKNVK